MAQFSTLFGHTGSSIPYGSGYIVDGSKVDLHESNELEPSRCTSCMIEHIGISSMSKSRVSLLSIDYSTLCFGSLSLQEGVTLTTYPLELRTCYVKWLPDVPSLFLWSSFGMRSLLVLQILPVLVTMLHIYFI